MAETAKAMKGVEAIMRGESVNAVSTGAVKQVAEAAPYEMRGDASKMVEAETLPGKNAPKEEAVAFDGEFIKEEKPAEEARKEEPVYTDKDIIRHEKEGNKMKEFFEKEMAKAKASLARFSAPMKMSTKSPKSAKKQGGDKSASEDESYG